MTYYPIIGHKELLVYRECEHGCWCATGEGGQAPSCAAHRLPMMPPRPLGPPAHRVHEMRSRRLGFYATFGYEPSMVKRLLAWRRKQGLVSHGDGEWIVGGHVHDRTERYFTPAETAVSREAVA